ncbi:XkdQ/YqbQ family protein [Paenibacillus periandrae]|uniref:XkdQ/YqbQ family protein n=1 Tax=Paenibacillus periandrae TaxID=1761741 RepID=UPI001F09BDE0|nr:hypothetical protein [Paenibacillus periandrae]
MLEIIIDNRDGYLWDISGIVSDVTYKTARIGRASSMEITFLKGGLYEAKEFKYTMGDVVRIQFGNTPMFLGYIFVIDDGRDEQVKITAYDQLRYLMVTEYYQGTNKTATEVLEHFVDRLQLKMEVLIDTEYKIPTIREDNVKAMDIICGALESTLTATGERFLFFDNFGWLTLRNVKNMVLDLSLGDDSLMFDYKLKTSIEDSYNVVWLTQDNTDTGVRTVYPAQDSANVAKWGFLKLVQNIDEKANAAQIKRTLENLIQLKNRVGRSFQIDSIGDIRVRAGCYLHIDIKEIGIDNYYMVNECTHKFDGDEHTMTLELVDIRKDDKKVTVVT